MCGKSPAQLLKGFQLKTPSKKMTANEVLMIKNLLATRQYHQHQIAAIIQVNQGRVSETKNGHYDWLLPKADNQISML